MKRVTLAIASAAFAGCLVTPKPPEPPAAMAYPADLFPAPPGFRGTQLGPNRWAFTGFGKPEQLRLYYRVSCVEYYDWTAVSDEPHRDGGYLQIYERDGATLHVHVQSGADADTLACRVTLDRGKSEPE